MRGAVLGAALLLWPMPAVAQDLAAELTDLLRARDCAMTEEDMLEVFTVMGRSPEEVRAAMAGLVAAGSALQAEGELRLAPAICRPPLSPRVPPLSWIEDRLAEAPGCGRLLDGLLAEAKAEGIVPEALDRVVAALSGLGRIVVEDGSARLRSDLCGPTASRDRGLDRVLLFGRDSFRAVLALMAMERGCRLAFGRSRGAGARARAPCPGAVVPGERHDGRGRERPIAAPDGGAGRSRTGFSGRGRGSRRTVLHALTVSRAKWFVRTLPSLRGLWMASAWSRPPTSGSRSRRFWTIRPGRVKSKRPPDTFGSRTPRRDSVHPWEGPP